MTSERVEPERASGDAGFTLLEVVVALALLALITALLAESIGGARRVLAVVERNTAANAVVAAQAYLRSALAQAIPAPNEGGSENPDFRFTGSPNTVRFTTAYAPQGQYDGVYRVEIGIERSAGAGAVFDLVVNQTLVRAALTDSQASPVVSRRSKLVSNVAAVTFAYFGDSGDDQYRLQWHNVWPVSHRLPRLVRIDVKFASGDARVWYRLQVPLQLAE